LHFEVIMSTSDNQNNEEFLHMNLVAQWRPSRLATAVVFAIGSLLLPLLLLSPAHASSGFGCQYTDSEGILGGVTTQQRSVITQDDTQYSSSTWVNAACGSPNEFTGTLPILTTGKLLPGQQAVVSVTFGANVICQGASAGNFCEARVLLNGQEMVTEPDNFHLGTPLVNDWQNNTFTRTKVVTCPLYSSTGLLNVLNLEPCTIGKVQVQVRTHTSTLLIDAQEIHASAQIQTLVL
jgi:hypothetical protein